RQDNSLMPEQFTDGEFHGAAGADIFGAGELFFNEAVELCFRFPAGFLVGDCDILYLAKNDQREDGVNRKTKTCPPIFNIQGNQDADQQETIRYEIQGKL